MRKFVVFCVLGFCFFAPFAHSAELTEKINIFGVEGTLVSGEIPRKVAAIQQRWNALHEKQASYGSIGKAGTMPEPTLKQWTLLAATFPRMDTAKQLRVVNGFFNNWGQIEDTRNYKTDEYWACAGEFIEKGGGDCEDFAMTKYIALRQLGWSASKLWFVIVRDNQSKQGHAVLVARHENTLFVLDNVCRPAYLILDHKLFINRYIPVLAMNEENSWVFPLASTTAPTTNAKVQKR